MGNNEFLVAVDMTNYNKKIENYSFEQLQAEKQKLMAKQTVNYIKIDIITYTVTKKDISNNPDEKNRIYTRKKIAEINKIINAKLNEYTTDFSSYWTYINNEFLKTTSNPDYASARLENKSVPLADKLNLKGICAYRNYLMVISKALDKYPFKMAVQIAIDVEMDADKDFDRLEFFSKEFLPKNIDAIYKNLAKENCINKRMKQLGNVKKADNQEKETETK